jgi:NADH:ubiquinone oxidoreductase subunit H
MLVISLLVIVIAERKILAAMQGREGPSVVGLGGILQTAVDGLKVFFKNIVFSRRSFKIAFFVLPLILMFLNFFKIAYIPTSSTAAVGVFEYDIFLIYVITSIDVFVFILSSWMAFTSKFPTLAAVRELAQMCSFELVYGFCVLAVILNAGSLCFRTCIASQSFIWFFFILTPYAFLFFIAILAESHRIPIDTSESESELVAGYQTEHGGFNFSFFYLAEYGGIIISSLIFSILFLGGWGLVGFDWLKSDVVFASKIVVVLSAILLTRCSLPRLRLKTALGIAWTQILPFSNASLPFYMWISYIFGSIRWSEYSFLNFNTFRNWLSNYYYTGTYMWFRRVGGYRDLRRDSAATNVSVRDVITVNLFLNLLRSRSSGNSLISDVRYPYDRNLVDAVTIGGVNSVLGRDRVSTASTLGINLFNLHAPLNGALYETFLNLFDNAEFVKRDTSLPYRAQVYGLARDLANNSSKRSIPQQFIFAAGLLPNHLDGLSSLKLAGSSLRSFGGIITSDQTVQAYPVNRFNPNLYKYFVN